MAQIEESVVRYLQQFDTADRQEPSEALTTKTTRLKEKIEKLKEEMPRLRALEVRMLATPDQQISPTDPDARSMATNGRGSGVVGYNVQIAVDTEHHLIITHEVPMSGPTDRNLLTWPRRRKRHCKRRTSRSSPTVATSASPPQALLATEAAGAGQDVSRRPDDRWAHADHLFRLRAFEP
jgi:hypothetical protein